MKIKELWVGDRKLKWSDFKYFLNLIKKNKKEIKRLENEIKEYKQETCIYFASEEIGGIPELNLIQWAWYCDKTGKMEDDIDCINCKDYIIEKDLE